MGNIELVSETGKFTLNLGLFLESGASVAAAAKAKALSIEELLKSNRMVFSDSLIQDEKLGDLSDVKIESLILPPGVKDFQINLIEWSCLYLDGDDAEIVSIFCEGSCTSEVGVPVQFHSEGCPGGLDKCAVDCNFDQEWWRLNAETWNEFEISLRHTGYQDVLFTGWVIEPPEFG
jgi:hypothetical protein